MTIKERYQQFVNKHLTIEDFHEIVQLKNDCKLEMNQEYLYLCDLLIIDSYIDANMVDEALKLAIHTIEWMDRMVFKKIFVSYLDRIIYLCIQKKNMKSALRYSLEKRNHIDIENIDLINRWYLELAYIYADLNQLEKALVQLKAILSNYPSDDTKSLTLSNLTKLYIDQKQITEAKQSLSECLLLCEKLEDKEGLQYCDYLNAKIYILENDYDKAKKLFRDLFPTNKILPDHLLGIGIEYIQLLYDTGDIQSAKRFITQYSSRYQEQSNLEVRKHFSILYIKVLIAEFPTIQQLLLPTLIELEDLDKEIAVASQFIFDEVNEEDKLLEINNTLSQTIKKIEKTVQLLQITFTDASDWDVLIDFSKKLQEIVHFEEALYVIFHKTQFEIIPEFNEHHSTILTYEYKKSRLYERKLHFSTLENTVFERLLRMQSDFLIDFTDTTLHLKDPITEKTFLERGIQSLISIPLFYEKEIYAAVCFTSKTKQMLTPESMLIIKIATTLLESKLIHNFYQEFLHSQRNVLQIAIGSLQDGMFYLDINQDKMVLTPQLTKFLGIHTKNYQLKEFRKFIKEEDKEKLEKLQRKLSEGDSYELKYTLNLKEEEYTVVERVFPYISKDGNIRFYVGTIHQESVERNIVKKETWMDFKNEEDYRIRKAEWEKMAKDVSFKFTLCKYTITNTQEIDNDSSRKQETIQHIVKILESSSAEEIFLLKNGIFICYYSIVDSKKIDKIIEDVFRQLDKGITKNEKIIVFTSKASYVRYPRDTSTVSNLDQLLAISHNTTNRLQGITEQMKKMHSQSIVISECAKEHIQNKSIELIGDYILSNDVGTLCLIQPNIHGIPEKDLVNSYLSDDVVIEFELLMFNELIKKDFNKQNSIFIFPINLHTIHYLLLNKKYYNLIKDNSTHLVFLIYNYDSTSINLLHQLHSYGLRFILDYKVWKQLTLQAMIQLPIWGIFINEAIDRSERDYVLKLFLTHQFYLLVNYEYEDYRSLLIRSKKYIPLKR